MALVSRKSTPVYVSTAQLVRTFGKPFLAFSSQLCQWLFLSPEGPYVTVGDKWGSDTNATTSVPLAQVLDRKPTAAEWAAVEAEACSQLLQGLGEHLTFHEVCIMANELYMCHNFTP